MLSVPEEISSVTFQAPFTAIISGPTKCGKTTLLSKILNKTHFLIHPNNVIAELTIAKKKVEATV